jgi:hypothetical protein
VARGQKLSLGGPKISHYYLLRFIILDGEIVYFEGLSLI